MREREEELNKKLLEARKAEQEVKGQLRGLVEEHTSTIEALRSSWEGKLAQASGKHRGLLQYGVCVCQG